MIALAPGTRLYLACRPVSTRYGFDGLAAQVSQVVGADPFSGHLFLFRIVQSILALPDDTRLFTGHDYRPGGRDARWESTVASQKMLNTHVRDYNQGGFVELRTRRDQTLRLPKLMLSALQVNLMGGQLPAPERDGHRYLKVPINAFSKVPWN